MGIVRGRVRGWLVWLFLLLLVLSRSFPFPNSKSSSQFAEGSKHVVSQRTLAKQEKTPRVCIGFVKRIDSYSCHAVCRHGAG